MSQAACSGPPRISRRSRGQTRTRRRSRRLAWNFAAATRTTTCAWRSSSRPRTISSCAGCTSPTAPARRDRSTSTSYAEVVLAPDAADALHPAFSNLFVQTEILDERHAILCTRRPRSLEERVPWMFHRMAVHGPAAEQDLVRDGPLAVHRPRAHAREPSRHGRGVAFGHRRARCWTRSSRSAIASRSSPMNRRRSTWCPARPKRATSVSPSSGNTRTAISRTACSICRGPTAW